MCCTILILVCHFIILLVVLYGFKTWSLTLTVFKNRMLRKIFRSKRDELRGGWRRLDKEELNNLYSSPNIIRVMKSRRMRWTGLVARVRETRSVYRILVGKPERKRTHENQE